MNPRRVRRIVQAFQRQHERGVFPGGQLVVRRRGLLVVDEAIGMARGPRAPGTTALDAEPAVPFTPSTRSCVFSAGKPLVALAIALLEARRLVDVEAPVATYWPDFAQSGKAEITVLDVLTHRSGLYVAEIERRWQEFGDWDGIVSRVAASAPVFPRGTLAYQPLSFGWILGEIVRRVTGRPIAPFLDQEILQPAGLDDLRLGVPRDELPSLARSYWMDRRPPSLAGEVISDFELAQNSAEWLTAVVPGGGTIATARSLARFYDALLRGLPARNGAPLIAPDVLRRYLSPQARGTDRVVKMPLVLGRGFALGWIWPHPYGWWNTSACFGHGGNFNTLAWADPTTGCAIAYVTNGNRAPMKLVARCAPIGSAVRAACA